MDNNTAATAAPRYIRAALAECEGFTQEELDQGVISCLMAQFPIMAAWLDRCHKALGTEMFLELCPLSEAERVARLPQIVGIENTLSDRAHPPPRPLALLR